MPFICPPRALNRFFRYFYRPRKNKPANRIISSRALSPHARHLEIAAFCDIPRRLEHAQVEAVPLSVVPRAEAVAADVLVLKFLAAPAEQRLAAM